MGTYKELKTDFLPVNPLNFFITSLWNNKIISSEPYVRFMFVCQHSLISTIINVSLLIFYAPALSGLGFFA